MDHEREILHCYIYKQVFTHNSYYQSVIYLQVFYEIAYDDRSCTEERIVKGSWACSSDRGGVPPSRSPRLLTCTTQPPSQNQLTSYTPQDGYGYIHLKDIHQACQEESIKHIVGYHFVPFGLLLPHTPSIYFW